MVTFFLLIFVVAPLAWFGLWLLVIRAFVRRGGRLAVVGTVASVLVALAVPYWAVLLTVFTGDDAPAPPPWRVPLPPGARITSTEIHCASGGCWLQVEFTPSYYGDDAPQCSWPSPLDPRKVCWDGPPGSGVRSASSRRGTRPSGRGRDPRSRPRLRHSADQISFGRPARNTISGCSAPPVNGSPCQFR